MRKLIKYLIIIFIGLLTALYIATTKKIFEKTSLETIFHILSDAFFVPGVVITGMGLLIYCSNEGAFDGITYAMMAFINMFRSKSERKYHTYLEYKQRPRSATKVSFILISGLIILSISIIMFIIYKNV